MARIEEKQSKRIWSLKAFAILSVFFAHMPCNDTYPVMSKLYALIGIAGVPFFLFLSGYLNYGKSFNITKKVRTIMIPVIVLGGLSFLLSVFALGVTLRYGFVVDMILYLLGSRSIFYFVTILLFCFIASYFCNTWILIGLSILSITIGHDYIPHNDVFTRYLNPFNFIIYFELGYVARQYNLKICNPWIAILTGIALSVASWFLFSDTRPSYFSIYCLLFFIGAFLIIDGILHITMSGFGVYVGKISFVIYLTHISFASYINSQLQTYSWGCYIKVIIAFSVVLILVYFLDTITQQNTFLQSLRSFIGFR